MITKEEFEALSPFDRGYAVYMAGARDDQPNIPDEKEPPYPVGSMEFNQYLSGQRHAVLEAQDNS